MERSATKQQRLSAAGGRVVAGSESNEEQTGLDRLPQEILATILTPVLSSGRGRGAYASCRGWRELFLSRLSTIEGAAHYLLHKCGSNDAITAIYVGKYSGILQLMVRLDTTRRQALPGPRNSAPEPEPLPGAVPGPPPHAPLPLPPPLPPTSDLDFAAALEIFDSEEAEQLAWIDTEDRLAQQLVERLVSLGATVNFKQLLSRACAAGHICLVRRLLSCELQLSLPPAGRAPQPTESMLSRQQRACKDLQWTFLVACYADTIKQARHAGRCMKLLQLLRKLYREQEAGDGGGGGPAAYAGADVPDRLRKLERQSLAANTNPRMVLGLVTRMAHPWASGAAFRTSGGAAGAAGATAGATAAGPSTPASSSGTAAMLLPTAATVADRLAPWSVCSREHGTSAATAADVTGATVPEPLPSRRKRQMLQREQASQQRQETPAAAVVAAATSAVPLRQVGGRTSPGGAALSSAAAAQREFCMDLLQKAVPLGNARLVEALLHSGLPAPADAATTVLTASGDRSSEELVRWFVLRRDTPLPQQPTQQPTQPPQQQPLQTQQPPLLQRPLQPPLQSPTAVSGSGGSSSIRNISGMGGASSSSSGGLACGSLDRAAAAVCVKQQLREMASLAEDEQAKASLQRLITEAVERGWSDDSVLGLMALRLLAAKAKHGRNLPPTDMAPAAPAAAAAAPAAGAAAATEPAVAAAQAAAAATEAAAVAAATEAAATLAARTQAAAVAKATKAAAAATQAANVKKAAANVKKAAAALAAAAAAVAAATKAAAAAAAAANEAATSATEAAAVAAVTEAAAAATEAAAAVTTEAAAADAAAVTGAAVAAISKKIRQAAAAGGSYSVVASGRDDVSRWLLGRFLQATRGGRAGLVVAMLALRWVAPADLEAEHLCALAAPAAAGGGAGSAAAAADAAATAAAEAETAEAVEVLLRVGSTVYGADSRACYDALLQAIGRGPPALPTIRVLLRHGVAPTAAHLDAAAVAGVVW